MADRWSPGSLENSTYVRPPFVIADDGSLRNEWRDRWDMTIFDERR